MRVQATALLALTAVASICATLAGCSSGASAQAPAVSTRQAQGHGQTQVTSPPLASATSTEAAYGTPTAQTSAPGPAPSASPSSRSVTATLASGLYTDAPDGTPHYVLSFTAGAGSALSGSASFLYQDGRVATVGSYAGKLSGSEIVLTFRDGKALSGKYTPGRLDLAGCTTALPLAARTGCTFTYHGHVP